VRRLSLPLKWAKVRNRLSDAITVFDVSNHKCNIGVSDRLRHPTPLSSLEAQLSCMPRTRTSYREVAGFFAEYVGRRRIIKSDREEFGHSKYQDPRMCAVSLKLTHCWLCLEITSGISELPARYFSFC
jgi:hypothetical protein